MAFWNLWQTWEKMTLVLGCSICVVFVYAFGVRYRNSRNVQRHKLRIAAEIAERGEVTQAMRASAEIPFGIRAIEKGCEIEGVWNSKASTPLQTPLGSKAPSPIIRPKRLQKRRRSSSVASVSALDMPEPALVTPTSRQPESPFKLDDSDFGVNAPRVATIAQATGREQQTFPPQVPCRYEPLDPDSCPHHLSTVVPPAEETKKITQGLSMGTITSQAISTYSGNTSARSTSTDTNMRRTKTLKAVHELPKPPPRTTRDSSHTKRYSLRPRSKMAPPVNNVATFDLINAHRHSHAAEIGQLPSRKRRNGSISVCSSTLAVTSSSLDTSTDQSPTRAHSWPTTQGSGAVNTDSNSIPAPQAVPFRAFVKTHPVASDRRASMPEPEMLQEPKVEFKQSHATLPLPRCQPSNPRTNARSVPTRRCPPSAWTERVQEQMEDIASDATSLPETSSARVASADIISQNRLASQPPLPSQKQFHSKIPLPSQKSYFAGLTPAERRQAPLSHINTSARKINSGFELLPPGALGPATNVKEWGQPLASNGNSVRGTRKLQKRDRSGSRERIVRVEELRRGKENSI